MYQPFLLYESYKIVAQNYGAEDNAVYAEGREGVAADIVHKSLDSDKGNYKSYSAAYDEDTPFLTREHSVTVHKVFQNLQCGCTQHCGNGKEERKLCSGSTGDAQKAGTDNGGAGAGGSGDKGQHLKCADAQCGFI